MCLKSVYIGVDVYLCIKHTSCFVNECTATPDVFRFCFWKDFFWHMPGTNSKEIISAESLTWSFSNPDNVPSFKVLISTPLSETVRPYD